jgi:hypothetical protein
MPPDLEGHQGAHHTDEGHDDRQEPQHGSDDKGAVKDFQGLALQDPVRPNHHLLSPGVETAESLRERVQVRPGRGKDPERRHPPVVPMFLKTLPAYDNRALVRGVVVDYPGYGEIAPPHIRLQVYE